jgi:single-strand DNA-binding protein
VSTNVVVLVGNVGRDPELKITEGGKKYCAFSIAVNDGPKGADGKFTACWYRCCAWEKTAEVICKHVEKGSRIGITGRLTSRKWKDEATGKDVTSVEIIVGNVEFLSSKGQGTDASATETAEEVSF